MRSSKKPHFKSYCEISSHGHFKPPLSIGEYRNNIIQAHKGNVTTVIILKTSPHSPWL